MRIKAKELPDAAPAEPCFPEDDPIPYMEEPVPEVVEQAQKERKTSNVVLAVLAVFLLAFIVAMIVIFCVKGSTPDTLIQCVLGAGGLEALVLAGIKVSKVLAGEKSGSGPPDGMG